MQHRKGSLYSASHRTHTHSYCNKTHTNVHANTHALWNTNSPMHFNNLDSISFKRFFFPIGVCESIEIQEKYNRIDYEPGL